jgi:hypothetical protein
MGYGYHTTMKMTFEIATPVALRFKSAVPSGRRSGLVTELLAQRLKIEEASLEAACRKANRLEKVNREMKDWERLNESDDSTW